MDILSAILIGAVGSIVAVIVIGVFSRTKAAAFVLGSSFKLAADLRKAGVTRFYQSREDYPGALPSYLAKAQHSLGIVSISLKRKDQEGDLVGFFRTRLAQNSNFRIRISLLAPDSPAAGRAADMLNISEASLNAEITTMLDELLRFRSSLVPQQQNRLEVRIHDSLPMGSAILIDAAPDRGTIQVETKLHRAPPIESFAFEIVGPSPFYERHYRAWTLILDESKSPGVPVVTN